jgi:hypothetical protein
MKNNVRQIEDTRRRRTEVEEQRQVTADALRNVARELRKLEKMQDDNGSNRAS